MHKSTLLLLGVVLARQIAVTDILTRPYLQAVSQHSVYVLIECSTMDTALVIYGTATTFHSIASASEIVATTAEPATYVHKIPLTGLAEATRYHYRGIHGASISEEASFQTAVAAGTPFRFAWMADCRTGMAVHDSIAALILQAQPVVSLYGGDLSVNSSYIAWKTEFLRPNQLALCSSVPFFNAVGNHEGWKANTQALTRGPASASGTEAYYSVDYGDLHVVVINTELPYSAGSPQYAFIEEDLKGSTARWKIAIAHRPAYCGGGHDEDTDMVALTAAVLEKNGVQVVIGGHTHFYQHNLVNGIRHLVIGSSGAPLYTPVAKEYTIKSAKSYNYAIGDVTPDSLRLVVYNEKGEELDRIVLTQAPDRSGEGEGERIPDSR